MTNSTTSNNECIRCTPYLNTTLDTLQRAQSRRTREIKQIDRKFNWKPLNKCMSDKVAGMLEQFASCKRNLQLAPNSSWSIWHLQNAQDDHFFDFVTQQRYLFTMTVWSATAIQQDSVKRSTRTLKAKSFIFPELEVIMLGYKPDSLRTRFEQYEEIYMRIRRRHVKSAIDCSTAFSALDCITR